MLKTGYNGYTVKIGSRSIGTARLVHLHLPLRIYFTFMKIIHHVLPWA